MKVIEKKAVERKGKKRARREFKMKRGQKEGRGIV